MGSNASGPDTKKGPREQSTGGRQCPSCGRFSSKVWRKGGTWVCSGCGQ